MLTVSEGAQTQEAQTQEIGWAERLLDDLSALDNPPRGAPQRVRVLAFRRRVLAALIGFLVSTAVIGAVPGMRTLWLATAVDGFVLVVYVAVLVHARNVAARHEWDLARLAPERSQAWLLPDEDVAACDTAPSPDNQVLDRWALVPFMLACLAGSLLTPFVAVSRWFARTDLAFAKAWAERVAGWQTSLRHRSRRALTVSVAATVGVTGFGSLLNVALAQPASAAPAAAAPARSGAVTTLSDVTPLAATMPGDATDAHYQVVRGDTLWGISHHYYGNGVRWPEIAHANPTIANPNLIYPGQSFLIPGETAPGPDTSGNQAPAAPAVPAVGPQQQAPSQIQGEAQGQLSAEGPLRTDRQSPASARPAGVQVPAGAQQALPAPSGRPQTPPVAGPTGPAAASAQFARPAGAGGGVSLGAIWACIRQHESGGNYADTSGGGYYGAYQFLPSTWNSAMMALGLTQYANGRADLAPASIQDQAARWLQARSGWGQWPVSSRLCGAN